MQKKILAITIVVVMVLAASGGALYFLFFSGKSGFNALDGCYADITDADYLVAYLGSSDESEKTTASAMMMSMSDYYYEGGNDCALYKIDNNGQYDPIKFYKDGILGRSEVNYKHDLVFMEKIGDDMIYLIYTADSRSHKYGPGSVVDPEQYVVSLENGKVYAVPDGNHVNVRSNEFGFNIFNPVYDYIGEYQGKHLFLKGKVGDNENTESVCTMEVVKNKLVIEEVFKVDRLGTYIKIYKDDVIVMTQNPMGNNGSPSPFVRFSNGHLYSGPFKICDGYVCKTVEYTNNLFPTSCERFNADGTTTHIDFTAAESFRIAYEEKDDSIIYKYESGDDRVLVKLNGNRSIQKITLKSDLTTSSDNVAFENMMFTNGSYPVMVDIEGKRLYTYQYNNYKSNGGVKEPTMVDGKMVYRFENGKIRTFNLETNEEGIIEMPLVTLISTLNIVNGKAYVTGISSTGQQSNVRLNSDGTITTVISDMELRTYILLPVH